MKLQNAYTPRHLKMHYTDAKLQLRKHEREGGKDSVASKCTKTQTSNVII